MPALLIPQLDPGSGGQPLDRLGEPKVVDPLHEFDDIAALGAGEAVPKATRRSHVERRRLLFMKRAQRLERVRASGPQLQILPHDLVNRGALADQRDVFVADPASQVSPSATHPYARR